MKKVLAIVTAMTLAVSVAACQKKEEPKVVAPKSVSVANSVAAKATVESLDARVSALEARMAVARKQYAKDRALLEQRLNVH